MLEYTERKFELLKTQDGILLAQQSSAIGPYADSWDYPGSSYLWLGDTETIERAQLNREQVAEFALRLTLWAADASMRLREDPKQAAEVEK